MKSALKSHSNLLSIASILVLSGCGAAGNKDPSGYSINAQMSVVQNLTVEERAVATRICYAYQSKSSSFRSQNYNGGTFTFDVNSRNCVDARANYKVNSVLKSSSTSMTLVPDTDKPFVTSVQTDQSGYLAQLCGKIQNNKPISNTVTETTTKVQISFFRDSLDSYTLKYFAPDANKVMKIESMETYKVRTQSSVGSGQIQGMDESYSLFQTCGTSDKYSEFTQQFSSFTK
jgi:hypothetical protein